MTKKVINQKGKFDEELINTIEPNFVFKNKPINRFNFTESDEEESQSDKAELLNNLEKKINSIENCNFCCCCHLFLNADSSCNILQAIDHFPTYALVSPELKGYMSVPFRPPKYA